MLSQKNIEYTQFVLSDMKVIELLLRYRYKYDEYWLDDCTSTWDDLNGNMFFNEEAIITYQDLDKLIEQCNFNKTQRKMIKMLEQGYGQGEIARLLGMQPSKIRGRLKTIFKRIKQQNDWNWRKVVYKNKIGLKTQQCITCKEELPATEEFFYIREDNDNGFHSKCKRCF